MLHVNVNYFNSIINYEKAIFDKKNNLKSATWRPSTQEKPLSPLGSKKAYGLKISQSIIYVKEYIYMFFSTLKEIIQTQSKTQRLK